MINESKHLSLKSPLFPLFQRGNVMVFSCSLVSQRLTQEHEINLVRHSRSLLSGNPEHFHKELDSGWSLSLRVVSREPAGMTTLKVFSGQ